MISKVGYCKGTYAYASRMQTADLLLLPITLILVIYLYCNFMFVKGFNAPMFGVCAFYY